MQENIRKIVETAGCPILAVPLFLRQGWETTMASPVLVFAFGSSSALYPCLNVAKSVAKARKTHQGTTPQPQPHQQHRRHFPQKTPHPPPFPAKPGEFGNLGDGICGSGYPFPRFLPIESPDFNLIP